MLLPRLFVISVVLKATRVMPATVMRRSVSDAERRAILSRNVSVAILFASIVMRKVTLAVSRKSSCN